VSENAISNFFVTINPYKNDNAHQKKMVEIFGCLIFKSHLPIQFVENI
jgi:hypothetical protein